jgi:hypothetical protein
MPLNATVPFHLDGLPLAAQDQKRFTAQERVPAQFLRNYPAVQEETMPFLCQSREHIRRLGRQDTGFDEYTICHGDSPTPRALAGSTEVGWLVSWLVGSFQNSKPANLR